MSLPKPVARVVRASVARREATPAPAEAAAAEGELEGLAAAARFHGVAGYVHHAVGEHPAVPEGERRGLKLSTDQSVITHLHALSDLRTLKETFDRAGIPWIAIKGAVLAEPVHGRVDLRAYSDLDLVVPGAALGDALEALEAAGSQVRDRNWTLIRDRLKGEVHLALPAGMTGDLHWHLINERDIRERFSIPMGDVFERRSTVQLGGLEVPTLSPEDTIVYIALHTMLSGGHRLVWLKDLERLLATYEGEPSAVREAARRWRAELVLGAAIRRVRRAIGCPPIASALEPSRGGTRAWLAVTDLAWRACPAEREDGSGSLGRIVSRSLRDRPRTSFRVLVRKSLAHRRDLDDPGIRRARLDASDPGSDRYDSGGAPARQAFLDAVRASSERPRAPGPTR